MPNPDMAEVQGEYTEVISITVIIQRLNAMFFAN
jgi:hypothetical protein